MLIRLKGQLLTEGIFMAILLAYFFPNIRSTGGTSEDRDNDEDSYRPVLRIRGFLRQLF
ncbi:MAG: hypothetical protein VYC82_00470 [Verrucomicrobiota bacterium]|nr:hypothetical protein [Verrucomicrobiota bacterium]